MNLLKVVEYIFATSRIFIASPRKSSYFHHSMIVCPVCSHANDEFAIKCVSCGSYIQDRVPTLDFFSTVWLMIESPKQAFKKIILAEHKNYVLFLGLFLGIAAAFALLWAKKSGNNFDNLFPVLLFGTFLGIVIFIPVFYAIVLLLHGISKSIGGKGHFRETYAIAGWSLVPIMLSVIFILPLELATLGLFLFSDNPSAFDVKPVVTSVLLALDGLLVLWSIILAGKGISLLHRLNGILSIVVVLCAGGAVAYASFFIYSLFNI